MFFTLRCVFWLGIVFIAIHHYDPDARFLRHAAVAHAPAAASATASAARALERTCLRTPRACAKLETKAGRALSAALVLAAELPSAQSLQPADFRPPWRGARLR
ncbi:MAG TPA: hypothetical protein VMU56_09430 [Beijerinckiaceae bacterium]|nr:hypothetical protein [Beijerinckiaceae bacterium]